MSRPSTDLRDLAGVLEPYRATGLDAGPEFMGPLLDLMLSLGRRVAEVENLALRTAGVLPLRATLQVLPGGRS